MTTVDLFSHYLLEKGALGNMLLLRRTGWDQLLGLTDDQCDELMTVINTITKPITTIPYETVFIDCPLHITSRLRTECLEQDIYSALLKVSIPLRNMLNARFCMFNNTMRT